MHARLTGRARKDREKTGEERQRRELATGGDSGEVEGTITNITQNHTDGPREAKGGASGGGSPSHMAARQGGGGAPRRR
jgi:hypothetical protein